MNYQIQTIEQIMISIRRSYFIFSSKLLSEMYLYLVEGFNFINGEIPKSFAMLLDLEFIDLSFNKIEGTDGISAFKDLPSLEELHLQYNLLGGNVGQFGNSESLRVIDLCM